MRAEVHRFSLADPGDVSGLAGAIDSGIVDPATIVAVIGKTHGNGLVNDYTRGYLSLALRHLIASRSGTTPDAVAARVPLIFSGGVEGVLSPHYAIFTVTPDAPDWTSKALAIGVAFTPPLAPADVGRARQIDLTAKATKEAMAKAGIDDPADVHFVQVKGPAFTLAELVAEAAAGNPPATDNPGKLMAFGRAASALGVAQELGELSADATEAAVLRDFSVFSSVASVSAGVEVRSNEVVVVGLGRGWSGPLTVGHAALADALDIGSAVTLARSLGFNADPQIPAAEAGRIRAAFVKCEADRTGTIRGRSHTMLNDGDMNEQRHIRGAVGAIMASVLNETAIFVSGGAEHQGPDGGGLIAIIAERGEPL
jgi:cyanuric acid amidohydrolase